MNNGIPAWKAESSLKINVTPKDKKVISIVLPCYNEEQNLEEIFLKVKDVTRQIADYQFKFCFIDNASTDRSIEIIEEICRKNDDAIAILNSRNFGFARSPFHGILEAPGDCVIMLATDQQEPPELIPKFINHWEDGAKVVVGQKTSSEESLWMYAVRACFYKTMNRISDINLLQQVTGFGLYDRRVLDIFRELNEPFPYTRGLITEIGLPYVTIPFRQLSRKKGKTKFNFMGLYDLGMLAVTSYAKTPMRIATLVGFTMSLMSLILAFVFLVVKLFFWDNFPAGYSSAIVSIFFLGSVQIFLLGLLGEYLLATMNYVKKRPLVVEERRLGDWTDR